MILTQKDIEHFGIEKREFKPSFVFRNGHISTMYPYVFRKLASVSYQRERIETVDGDFIDVDHVLKGSKNAVLLLHGLEGSSHSQYIIGMASKLVDVDIYAINHRSCSGELNRTMTMYHSGFTQDVSQLIDRLCDTYDSIQVVGYSLGGNIILKYLGNHIVNPKISSAVAVSVPVDLASSSIKLDHWTRKPYVLQFLMTLNKKIMAKVQQFPHILNEANYKNITNLIDYDHKVTAPFHGFVDAFDYYERASSKPQLGNINIPTLLINAVNDPFLAPECFPYEVADSNPNFHLWATKYGGHVGFGGWRADDYWLDQVISSWVLHHLPNRKQT